MGFTSSLLLGVSPLLLGMSLGVSSLLGVPSLLGVSSLFPGSVLSLSMGMSSPSLDVLPPPFLGGGVSVATVTIDEGVKTTVAEVVGDVASTGKRNE